jgi:hypothetical protein
MAVFVLCGLCLSSNFYKQHGISEAGSASVFRKEALDLVEHLDEVILNHWAPTETITC